MPYKHPRNRQPYGLSHPFDADGHLTKSAFYRQYNLSGAEYKPAVVLFAGSRYGNGGREGIYAQEVAKIDQFLTDREIWAITGGAPPTDLGLMSKVVQKNPLRIGISPYIFADRNGENSGVHPDAINLLTHDFPERKPAMGVLSDQAIMLPGGYGTLEEATEYLLQGAKDRKPLHILNVNGFYDPFFAQFGVLESEGLLSRNLASWTLSSNAQMLCEKVDNYFCGDVVPRRAKPREKRMRSQKSLQSFLHGNPNFIADAVERFVGWDAPRIGMIASGNILNNTETNKLRSKALTRDFVTQAAIFGQRVASRGAVLVLTGSVKGLRETAADAALSEGGKVIWIQKKSHDQPLAIQSGRNQNEIVISGTREYEKMAIADLVVESFGGLAGGLGTLDSILGVVTRIQTGCATIDTYPHMTERGDQVMVSELHHAGRRRSVVMARNFGGIWDPIKRQVEVCDREGFLGRKPDAYGIIDYDLFQIINDQSTVAMVDEIIFQARPDRGSYDLLRTLQQINRNVLTVA